MSYKIAVHSFYFGKWPDWIELCFESFKSNPTVDFYIFTDCDIEVKHSVNIFLTKINFSEYLNFIQNKIVYPIAANSPIKLCDFRPFLGLIHKDLFSNYDFYGWIDLDLFLGDVRSFYTHDILTKHSVFSSHNIRIAGHFSLFKNNEKNRTMYKKIYNWKNAIANPNFVGIDEHGITNAYTMTIFDRINEKFGLKIENGITRLLRKQKIRKLYLTEQYSTPFVAMPWLDGSINSLQPDTWYYIDGKITNSRDREHEFMYLHFMNFKSSTWRHDGTKAPWEGLKKICYASASDMKKGVCINEMGIHPIK